MEDTHEHGSIISVYTFYKLQEQGEILKPLEHSLL